jgi:hypothetical protein
MLRHKGIKDGQNGLRMGFGNAMFLLSGLSTLYMDC